MPRIEGLARGERVTRRMCRVCSTSAALVMTTMQICMPVSGGVPAIPRSDTRLICEDLAVLRKLPRSSRADDIAFLFDKFEGTLSLPVCASPTACIRPGCFYIATSPDATDERIERRPASPKVLPTWP